ncbi:ThiF family adenylyltransferase [Hylemonella sp. W303a]|uniref:tRNA threonylcarbamoyladenosine dehydratase n=1 Tax=Hylemonella sp. W303a TaxID=3389873 RepID=UPI00396B0071
MMQAVDTERPDFERRFGGLARLYGQAGAARIRSAHVVVVGIGGVGSWAVEGLARSGVGRLTLIDMDHVAESNINRQIHALDDTLGQAKVQAMRERIAQINPSCEVICIEEFVEPANWPGLIAQGPHVDAVIDACDQVVAKTAMAVWARDHSSSQRYITVGAAGGKTQAHLVAVDDLVNVTHDPLLAQLRYRLRKHHGAPRAPESSRTGKKTPRKIGIACVYSREAVQGPAQDDEACSVGGDGSLNCSGYGSLVSVTATFGLCASGWVLNRIAAADLM